MNYQKHYDRLIETRRNRILEEGVYYERHHIVMRSMGGTDDPENLVMLTAREHFLAHWLLWRIHRNRQSAFAFNAMCFINEGGKKVVNSRAHEEARIANSLLTSEFMKGRQHTLGYKHTEDAKRRISLNAVGMTGKKHSDESIRKNASAHRGNQNAKGKRSPEAKQRIAAGKLRAKLLKTI